MLIPEAPSAGPVRGYGAGRRIEPPAVELPGVEGEDRRRLVLAAGEVMRAA